MYDLDAITIVFGFVIICLIGLFPPLIVRYAILKRSIAKWPAIGTCALFWVINFVLFAAMGSQNKPHGALVLIAFLSYLIFRQGTAEKEIKVSMQASESSDSFLANTASSLNPTNAGRNIAIQQYIVDETPASSTDREADNASFAEGSDVEQQMKILYIKQRTQRLISAERISAEKSAAEKSEVERIAAAKAAAEKSEAKRIAAEKTLQAVEKAVGPNHPKVATFLNNLALLYKTQGLYTQSEPLYKRSLVIMEKTLGPEHPNVATCLNNLALLYKTQGRYAQAELLINRSLAIREKAAEEFEKRAAVS